MDIRGDSGYVIAPPSVSFKGEYRFINNADLIELPKELLKKIQISNDIKPYNGIEFFNTDNGKRHSDFPRYVGSLFRKFAPAQWDAVIPNIILAVDVNKNNPPLGYKEVMAIYNNLRARELSVIPNKISSLPLLYKIVSAKELLEKNTKEFPYIIDRLIPEAAITSITADSGQGKSLLSLIFAHFIATGRILFDEYPVKKSKVLIIDLEMDEDIIVSRFKALINEDCDIDYIYQQSWLINEEKSYKWIVDIIKMNGYKVVFFDTLTNIHDKEENSSKEMREINKKMLQLITDTGI